MDLLRTIPHAVHDTLRAGLHLPPERAPDALHAVLDQAVEVFGVGPGLRLGALEHDIENLQRLLDEAVAPENGVRIETRRLDPVLARDRLGKGRLDALKAA